MGKTKRPYTLEEKEVLGKDFAIYGEYRTPEAKQIVANNQQTNSYGITSNFKPSANYNNAMNVTNSLLSHLAKVKPVDSMKSMLDKIQSRPKFSYDINNDALFQQALSSAQKSGKTAMKDTMGQAASLTGGYGSSYSTAVGNNAYNDHIQRVYDNIPQYYNMALQTHQAETDELYKQYALMSDANNIEYQRLLDAYNISYGQAQDIYNKDYARWMDANDLAYRERDWNYGVSRDTLEDQRRDKEWEYKVGQDILTNQQTEAKWENYLEQQRLDNEQRDAEWENYLTQQGLENQLKGDIDRNGILSPEEMAYLQETNDISNKLSNGEDANKMSTYKQKAWEKYAESEASGDAYVDALGLSDEEKDEIYAYIDEHSTSGEEVGIVGKVSNSGKVSSFKTDEGDNFDVSVNGTDYRVENKGKVTDADVVEKLNKVKAENGDVFLHDGDAYVKFANGYYKVGATNIFMFKTSGYQDLLAALQQ